MTPKLKFSRRDFIRNSTYVTVGFLGLRYFLHSSAKGQSYFNEVLGYGPLLDDPQQIIDLPRGFSYKVLSQTGDFMDDGFRIPGAPDGMAAFSEPSGQTIIVCNHELSQESTNVGPYGPENELFHQIDRSKVYDPGIEGMPALGGTSTILYDCKKGQISSQFLSLAGTVRNCAGGPTPWGSWITCEETTLTAGDSLTKDHGFNFEVPATSNPYLANPVPLVQMGRFKHEAVAVDPNSGIIFQTEDVNDGLIYRFIPNVPEDLARGGHLQALGIKNYSSIDTRNWPTVESPSVPIQKPMEVSWFDLDDVLSPNDDLRYQGYDKGAARFARTEGMWYGNGAIYFASTNGGKNFAGQIWKYTPSPYEGTKKELDQPGQLELYLEPNNNQLLEHCDNLTVAPWGDLIVCEDGLADQYLRGITPEGKIYTLAHNSYAGNSEFCGACFAPNHPTLFVNIQSPGITLAITGPWESLS
ncbi:MAG: hypothetical protein DF168_01561 [Candidatus Moanabacter tarae]|uniref:Phosphatase n=1 Tax=Candidatus Moanibacter tarae TaxID=2200854 RepID=A0A2Z4ADL8_9BACT|nr:MAG: hypothetical protein DF168_01561 [Candidatus Moanabacter tarae]|tara:strand:+ start:389 stop:1798 length:1410 start_codon:yes stop_codon:yes gene_type:complete